MICPNCKIECKTGTDENLNRMYYKCPSCEFLTHANHLRIDTMFAFVAVDAENNEGVPAVKIGQMLVPLMCADKDRVDSLRSIALQLARNSKAKIKLIRFTNREELEEFNYE